MLSALLIKIPVFRLFCNCVARKESPLPCDSNGNNNTVKRSPSSVVDDTKAKYLSQTFLQSDDLNLKAYCAHIARQLHHIGSLLQDSANDGDLYVHIPNCILKRFLQRIAMVRLLLARGRCAADSIPSHGTVHHMGIYCVHACDRYTIAISCAKCHLSAVKSSAQMRILACNAAQLQCLAVQ